MMDWLNRGRHTFTRSMTRQLHVSGKKRCNKSLQNVAASNDNFYKKKSQEPKNQCRPFSLNDTDVVVVDFSFIEALQEWNHQFLIKGKDWFGGHHNADKFYFRQICLEKNPFIDWIEYFTLKRLSRPLRWINQPIYDRHVVMVRVLDVPAKWLEGKQICLTNESQEFNSCCSLRLFIF